MWAKLKELYEPHDGTTKLHTLATMFNMCVLQEEEDVPTFLSTWEAAMDDATTVGNCISEDIKIGEHSSLCIVASQHCLSYLLRSTMKTFDDKRSIMLNRSQ